MTSHQAKWQPICILITVLCLQSMDNDFSYCMLGYLCCKEFVRMTVGMGNHIDQFFHEWWRWISTVETLSSDKLLKKWSCRRDWFNSEVLSRHGCSKAWMWTRKKQRKSIIKCHAPHCTNCKNRFEWISWAAIRNWICNLCKRSFFGGTRTKWEHQGVVWQIMSFSRPYWMT